MGNSHKNLWMVLFQNCVRPSGSPTKMATTVQLRCYWKQLWSRWAITGSWEPLVFIPSPTKLRGDIVTLPSVRHNPCEHSRINILQWILTKLGTYLVLKRIWNPIDFQGHRSKVKITGSNIYRITSLWTL